MHNAISLRPRDRRRALPPAVNPGILPLAAPGLIASIITFTPSGNDLLWPSSSSEDEWFLGEPVEWDPAVPIDRDVSHPHQLRLASVVTTPPDVRSTSSSTARWSSASAPSPRG